MVLRLLVCGGVSTYHPDLDEEEDDDDDGAAEVNPGSVVKPPAYPGAAHRRVIELVMYMGY